MTAAGALDTARRIAARLDLPAYIYREGEGYHVACMEYASLTDAQRETCCAVVFPDGTLFGHTATL